ncbi:MAG: hypothetical protein PWP51_833 [Clostridiales bacterium]|jgi:amidohydrolase|nr:hypothetical protein [Clostridiales bacterium]
MTLNEQYANRLTTYRNTLHQMPEAGFEEYKTSAFIKETLEALHIPYESVLGTGVIGFVKGTNPEKTIAFRADIDGLSVTEKSSHTVHSQHEGYMHACGHDGHMAMLLGLASYLSDHRSNLKDNIVLIFQPAEEGPGGAEEIVKAGYLKQYQVDEIYGIHLYPAVPEGKIGIACGPMMAMTGEFDVDIHAKSAHGAMPQDGIDAIVVAGECIGAFQAIIARNISPIQPAVLTVGKLTAGERRNVIAGHARLEGTIRAFDKGVHGHIKSRIRSYLDGIEKAYDIQIETMFRDMYPPVINDQNLYDAFTDHFGAEAFVFLEPQMISEDFSFYQEAVPGLFFFIGTYNEASGHVYPLHNARFNFNHEALQHGLRTYIEVLTYRGSLV